MEHPGSLLHPFPSVSEGRSQGDLPSPRSASCSPASRPPISCALSRPPPVPAPWTLRRGEDSWARSLPPLPGSARDGRGGGAGLETNQPDGAPDNPAERSHPTQVRSTSPRGAEQAALPGPPLSLASPSAAWTRADRGRAPSPRAARRAGAPGAQQGAPARTRAARRAARGGGGGGGGAGGGRGAGTSGRR